MVREFYVAYAATILRDIPKGKKPLTQPRLREVLVRGQWVNILEEMIHCVLFSPKYWAPNSKIDDGVGLQIEAG